MTERDLGLDAAKAAAMLAVVFIHATASYTETAFGWAISDDSRHLGFDLTLWLGRLVSMPVFFVVAGYFAARSLARRGPAGFLKQRLLRLVLPLVLFLVPVSLSMNALWDWGAELSARGQVPVAVPALEGSELPVTLAHLWFLYYLIVFSAVFFAVFAALDRLLPAPSKGRRLASSIALPVAITALVAISLVPSRQLQLDQPLGFGLDPLFALYYGAFFAWGWALGPNDGAGRLFSAWSRRASFVAAIAFATLVPTLVASSDGLERAPLYAVFAGAVLAVSLSLAFVGLMVRVGGKRRWLRELADASYWIYIVHLPLVVLLQLGSAQLALPALVEVAVIFVVAIAVGVMSYRVLVLRSPLRRFVGR